MRKITGKFFSKKTLKRIVIVGCLLSIFTIVNHHFISQQTRDKLYNNVDKIPTNKVGLLLGTSKTLMNGQTNLYYKYRIDAAVKLFRAQKIAYILISGDNSRKEYSEPEDMEADLIKMGVPKEKIVLDYAGFRTLDSVVRSKKIFGQSQLTCISQPFHNERAIFIGRQKGMSIIGFNAKDVSKKYGIKVQIREYLARVKMLLDLFITKKQPKFLGEKINII